MITASSRIRGIVFDLDGTLYVSAEFAAAIQEAAAGYVAQLKGAALEEARRMIAATRSAIAGESGCIPTLSAVCTALGGTVQELHAYFSATLKPEEFLTRDDRVVLLLERLARQLQLHLYTNNNRGLTERIVAHLGFRGVFRSTRTIDDTWRAKPDEATLDLLLAEAGLKPAETLFVGDRYDVDLRLPEQKGCPVYLSQSIEQLLRLDDILIRQAGG